MPPFRKIHLRDLSVPVLPHRPELVSPASGAHGSPRVHFGGSKSQLLLRDRNNVIEIATSQLQGRSCKREVRCQDSADTNATAWPAGRLSRARGATLNGRRGLQFGSIPSELAARTHD